MPMFSKEDIEENRNGFFNEKTDWSGNPVPLTLMERVTFLEAKVKYLESELDRFALIVIKKTVMDVLKDSDRCSGGQLRY